MEIMYSQISLKNAPTQYIPNWETISHVRLGSDFGKGVGDI
jgi:hypothetical protein